MEITDVRERVLLIAIRRVSEIVASGVEIAFGGCSEELLLKPEIIALLKMDDGAGI